MGWLWFWCWAKDSLVAGAERGYRPLEDDANADAEAAVAVAVAATPGCS